MEDGSAMAGGRDTSWIPRRILERASQLPELANLVIMGGLAGLGSPEQVGSCL